jgi:radical SAM superfamily enzyme YgiQ (UPF0313 family)
MKVVDQGGIDALLIFPPLYSERVAGLLAEELISDAKHPFEHPQGVLSMASYARSSAEGKTSFDVRVLPLDAHVCQHRRETDGSLRWYIPEGTDVEAEACRIAEEVAAQLKPKVVGISVPYYLAEPIALTLAKHLRGCLSEDVPIVLGGQEVSFYDTRSSGEPEPTGNSLLEDHPEIDVIVRKEGEFTFQRLIERVSAGETLEGTLGITYRRGRSIVVEPDRPRGNLADIPALDYSSLVLPPDVTVADFLRSMNVSLVFIRGCAHGKCSFCTSSLWFGALSTLSESDQHGLARFLGNCRKTLRSILECGVREIQLLDETVNSSPDYFEGLCQVLESLQREFSFSVLAETRVDRINEIDLKRMKAAGITLLYLGIETGSPKVLTWMNKRLGTPLVADAELVREVSAVCGVDVLERFPAEIAQAVCACYLVKKCGLRLGTFFMVGHPGSSAAEEAKSLDLLDFMFDKGLLTSDDMVEVGIFMPLNGTAARNFRQVRLHVRDKRLWGRMSGHAVCDQQEIEAAFRTMTELVLTRQKREPVGAGVSPVGRSRWGEP